MIGLGLDLVQAAARRRAADGPPPNPPPDPPPAAAPATRFARFPALAAGWAAGRGLVSIVGDSTTFGLGAGSGGFYGSSYGANAFNPAQYLRDALNAAGIAAIDGCVVYGARNQENSVAGAGHYYDPAAFAVAGNWQFPVNVQWWPAWIIAQGGYGTYAWCPDGGAALTWDFGASYDRVEFFWLGSTTSTGGPGFTLASGGTAIGAAAIDQGDGPQRRGFQLAAATAAPLTVTVAGGHCCAGAVRAWNSAVPCVQVETLGNPSWQTSDWVRQAPLATIDTLGSHLFILNLGLNDRKVGQRSAADFKADLKTLAARCRAGGADVLLAVPTPGSDATSAYELPADYLAAIAAAASELGLPAPIDLRAIGLDHALDYYDEVHLHPSGYRKVGEAYAARLLAA